MTITNSANSMTFTGDGVATDFPVNFPVRDESTLFVSLYQISTATWTDLTLGQYTAVGVGPDSTGVTITYLLGGQPISSDYKLRVRREVPLTQEFTTSRLADFNPETLEDALDNVVMGLQQVSNRANEVSDLAEDFEAATEQAQAYATQAAQSATTAASAAATAAADAAADVDAAMQGYVTAAQTAKGLAEDAVIDAQEWAMKTEDVPVTGSFFSALHWAAKAAASAASAATFDPSSYYTKAVTYTKTEVDTALGNKQASSAKLTALDALTWADNKMVRLTGTETVDAVDAGAAGLSVLSKTTVAEILTLLGVGGSLLNAQFITLSGNITKTAGAKKWLYFVQGAGASGSAAAPFWGPSGALAIGVLDVSAVTTVPCVIGGGGWWPGPGYNSNGGGATSLNGTIVANGGSGGISGGTASATGGAVNIPGKTGGKPADSFFGSAPAAPSSAPVQYGSGWGYGGGSQSAIGNGGGGCIMIWEFG